MGSFSSVQRRARSEARIGRQRARQVATRLGVALRTARAASGLTQAEVADRAGVSQGLISLLERGLGTTSSIETWACIAAAVGEQLVGFLELAAGATAPRDIEHLRRQSALVELAARGGWTALPELAIDPNVARSRSIDIALIRPATREAVAVEIWNWFDDVGAALRGLDAKRSMLERRLDAPHEAAPALGAGPGWSSEPHGGSPPGPAPDSTWSVGGLFVVRGTRRNRALVAELHPLFAARFAGSAVGWLRTLVEPSTPMPDADGLLWTDQAGSGFRPARLGRREE
jgi:transcriptional regulator with XRE-family HTH domain